jgi:putative oxidoreductase
MRQVFYCDSVGRIGSVGLLLLRLVMGVAFVLHGTSKIQHPFDWMGPNATMPAILQGLAALSEFGGGLALLGGLLTRLASLSISSVMVVALATVHLPMGHPFVGQPGGPSYELPAVYLACAIMFFILGPGKFSLDALVFGKLLGRTEAGQNESTTPSPVTPTRRVAV